MSNLYIDIGGTYLRSEIEGRQESVLTKDNDLVEYIEKLLLKYDIKDVSISFAGQVSNGVIISSPNIRVSKKEIKRYFEKKYGIDLYIDNDLNCALLAESKESGSNSIALLYVGTGLGSSVMDNGRIVRGKENITCEIGHVPFKKAPFLCGCGKDNCLELFASGSGLEKWFHFKGFKPMKLTELKAKKEFNEIYENFCEALLRAAATITTLFSPKELILGGGIIESNTFLVDLIRDNIDKYALKSSLKGLIIKKSEIKDASLRGARELIQKAGFQ